MNRVFRVVWSKALHLWVVVSELAAPRGKSNGRHGSGAHEAVLRLLSGSILWALLGSSAPALAVDAYWDSNGTTINRGGNGTWDATSLFWSRSGDGVSGPYVRWDGTVFDRAIFGGVAGTVTLASPRSVGALVFENNGYVLTGSALTLNGAAPIISTNMAGDSNNGATYTRISSVLAGTAGFTKQGIGVLYLTGSNTFSGAVNVAAGSLVLENDAALGAATNTVSMAGGTVLHANNALGTGRTINLLGGEVNLRGTGVGSARFTGAGDVRIGGPFVTLSNNANDYTGKTLFVGNGYGFNFTSVADLGKPSALGAPTTKENGTIYIQAQGAYDLSVVYQGAGDTTNRDWNIMPRGSIFLRNQGTGTLTLTGDILFNNQSNNAFGFTAQTADIVVDGSVTGTSWNPANYNGGGRQRSITLNQNSTYTGVSAINNVTVRVKNFADSGQASALGTGNNTSISGGALSYTGTGASSNRTWTINDGWILNDGTGALTLSGVTTSNAGLTLGGSYTGVNQFSGAISGTGDVVSNGAGAWVLSGANTSRGRIVVNQGTLRAGSAGAFNVPEDAAVSGGLVARDAVVNGGVLDLGNFDTDLSSLTGAGGQVALGTANLMIDGDASGRYAGSITGNGGVTKHGLSTLTLSGASTYTGGTTLRGGIMQLDFSAVGAPASNILAGGSSLIMRGGRLDVVGAADGSSSQTFGNVNVMAGSNRISANSATLQLGSINYSGGTLDFTLPSQGSIRTTNTTLGGWATVNGRDYAKVVNGEIKAFVDQDYIFTDNAATWSSGQYITDTTGFFGTVGNDQQLAGLRYTQPKATTVTVANGKTLGVDGRIIVAPSVGAFDQALTGGSLTGAVGGGTVGVVQNSSGNFTIGSQIVDHGGATGFGKDGTGLVTLNNNSNSYTGATTISQGTLAVSSIGNGGASSSIGASSADSANLMIEAATLRYTGGTATSDRGFTIVRAGGRAATIDVTPAGTTLTFAGKLTSPDDSGFTKTGNGTLALNYADNDYVGITTVNGGVLSVSKLADGGLTSGIGKASKSPTNLRLLNNGMLRYTGSTVSSDRGFLLGEENVALPGGMGGIDVANAGATLTLSGLATGRGGLQKNGAGTLLLSGATNDYAGETRVNAGTLRLGSTKALGNDRSPLILASGATLDLGGFATVVGSLYDGAGGGGTVNLGSSTLTSGWGNFATFSGTITGTGGFTRMGINYKYAQELLGCKNTYTGVTTVAGGVLRVDCLANGGQASSIGASSNAAGSLVLGGSGRLIYGGGSVNIDRGLSTSGDGILAVERADVTLGLGGILAGGGTFFKDGPGTLVLSGDNRGYNGNMVVAAGTLRAGSSTAFGKNGLTVFNVPGAVADLAGHDMTLAWLSGTGPNGTISLGGATLTLNAATGTNNAFGGAISGGKLVKTGLGTQTLTGCNSSYTGSTTIQQGILAVDCLQDGGQNSSLGASTASASNLILDGGTLQHLGGINTSSNRQFTLGVNGGTLDSSGAGVVTFSSTAPVAFTGTGNRTLTLLGSNAGDNTLAAQLVDNGSGRTAVTKMGGGTWVLANTGSTYTGITSIQGGVLEVSKLADAGQGSSIGASTGAAANLVIGNNSIFRYTGTGDSTNRLFTLAAGTTFIESSGTGAVNFTNTGAVTLAGTNTNRTLALGGTYDGMNTMGGAIGDNGTGKTTLAKNDGGTWVLTGNNSYTGNTVINDGNLMIGNGGTTGNAGAGNVIVNAASSILSLNRSDTFTFGGTLSGPGTLTQRGSGTSVLTSLNNQIGAAVLRAGTLQVNGKLVTPMITMNGDSTLRVRGTVEGVAGATSKLGSTSASSNSTIIVDAGGVLSANGNLGDGNDVVDVAGTLNTGTDKLLLGDGDDRLVLGNGSVLAGAGVNGGAGSDDLWVDNAAAYVLDSARVDGFEKLSKRNGGVLTLLGDHSFLDGVTINAGTVQVGNGGATGTLLGDVANSGVLAFNRTGTLYFSGMISGSGGVEQLGTGTTVLTGRNGYTGTTTVRNGRLLVDGDQSAATGKTTVQSGATLGGKGTLGGTVEVADGGILAPGGDSEVTGSLTVKGNLLLSSGSTLNYDFGKANEAGGPLNDHVQVDGDLVLDGTLNVNTTPGGSFGEGVYRVISYNGALTDNGLLIGNTPAAKDARVAGPGGSNFYVQTSIAKQVNLVNTINRTLNYWDGAASGRNDGSITGGDGIWQNSAGNDNWTSQDGALNAPYADAALAIFSGQGGTVTVDNSRGQVSASGMQFLVDGYHLTGQALALSGNTATLQVGDGSATSAGITATISNALSGTAALVKTDLGTLVLGGANTFTGGITVNGGALQVSSDANLGDLAGGITLDGGRLWNTAAFTSARTLALGVANGTLQTDADLDLSGTITGAGALTKTGSATLIVSGTAGHTGGTTIAAGTLQLGNGGTSGMLAGDVTNNATLAFNRSDALDVAGLISGTGRVIQRGSGITTLSSNNTYTGGTTISSGTLQLGNGGTGGSLLGDVTNDAALAFNRSDAMNVAGVISGTGEVSQRGTGTTVLTGRNTYAGATTIGQGRLLIDGDQTGARGLTSVLNGGTLGGRGIVGGDVTVADGGILAAGGGNPVAGTLTINGALRLNQGSVLNYDFGQADVVGGALNDHIRVGGDLVLDGILNVSATPGGAFDVGVYRVISYDGALTNNGLQVGTIPSSNYSVQTSIDKQVNLVNANGLTLNYWDGAAGGRNDGSITGGNGTWQSGTGNDNWASQDGRLNAGYADAAFAVFSAGGGNVTVDNGLGQVRASGMQFMADGYQLNGGSIELVGATAGAAVLKVGDGTVAGTGLASTIDNVLGGTAALAKTDLGTLVLGGANTYTGGTRVNGGALQVSSDANLGDLAGGITLDGGRLWNTAAFTSARTLALGVANGTLQTDADLDLSGTITGAGALTKTGSATLIVSGTAGHTGGTTIAAGTLQLGNGGTSGMLAGDVTNNATLAFNRSDALDVAGLISGTGRVIQRGSGITTLSSNNTYTGGTTISSGTLQLGNGGTGGSLLGDVTNDAALAFNRSDAMNVAGVISGTGEVSQRGTGTTVLTGRNTYAGATTIGQGRLLIDGDQTGARGLTSVLNGGTLGGRGIVGGDVTVADGGILAAGGDNPVAGTLTINGALRLNQGSVLNYDFGQANVPGGQYNDLVQVGGDLVLDGILNVTTTPGRDFGVGVYRVFSYKGALTNNGMQVGAIPTPDYSVQTSIAEQVNLVNTGGQSLNWWDGVAGGRNDGSITGGDGIWQNSAGNDNWASQDGTINAPYADAAFAMFSANGGNVTVDNSLGQVGASGMQFLSDGYRLSGQTLTLTGSVAAVRVGDGTAAGGSFTATISNVLSGVALVEKTDLGTLVLSGTNTYAGGTRVKGGTLRISSNANLGNANAGLTLDGGNLQTTAAFDLARTITLGADGGSVQTDADLILSGAVAGNGHLTKRGMGTLALTGAAGHAGGTTISSGTLQLGNGGISGSLLGDVTNNAILAFNRSNALEFAGLISGSGGVAQRGAGTTVLISNNTYAGGTTISSGVLQLGNGGTSGSLLGNVVNDAMLAFNRSDTLNIDGRISGTGGVTQQGGGTTVLTGSNTYTGATTVSQGRLLVDGDQSAASGRTTVHSGATLGGKGIVGGDVDVADGGILAPGGNGQPAGALTINGNLNLSSGAVLDYQFGKASAVGDALNDHTQVNGNLVLDGTLNVTTTAGGSFGEGVYRVFTYNGTLTNNGLEVGSMPSMSNSYSVQTSIARQVNLINSVARDLNFWDGAAGGRNDNTITGGDGVWQNNAGNDNWTDQTGAVNTPYANGALAIFSGQAGTVTVDNSKGQVSARGMQFATGGYRLTGQAIALTGSIASLRVGDGTAAGAGYTATIGNELTGAAQVEKTDRGTLVLTGDNTYAGGTSVRGGTLQVSRNANLGAASGGLTLDGGRLQTTAAFDSDRAVTLGTAGGVLQTDADLALNGAVTGSGRLTKAGTATLTLTGTNGHAGGTTIEAGTLQLGSGGTSGSLAGDVINNATLAFNRSDALTMGGQISGTGRVQQRGAGTTVLTADNTYGGGTTIASGTLQLGNDSTRGSLVGDVDNNGALVFKRSNVLALDGNISGSGQLMQSGTGTTVLKGSNRYAGATTIHSGGLLINGSQSAATGLTSVMGGALLGGSGIIGGDVVMADGAIINPGDLGNAPATLTINGKLGLGRGSLLNYNFGQANVVGGPLNDHMQVGADLVLDGTLNVDTSAGGNVDAGVYRVISYNGALTNNGLQLGAMPSTASNFHVQTSIDKQVNLVNTAGQTLNFWDGAAGARNDGAIAGGDGTWQNNAGNDNWTSSDGLMNAPYADATYAVFSANAGTVTVDDGLGQVRANAMQFISNGYQLQGDAIELVGTTAKLQVGDGSSLGAGYTATIGNVLTGTAQLQKTDLGTLVLAGVNTYTGGTAIRGGTVQVSSDANLGDLAGGITLDGGRLQNTSAFGSARAITLGSGGGTLRTDGGLEWSGAINGSGGLTKDGAATLILAGNNGYTGGTTITAGTLQLGNGGSDGTLVGNVVNNGALVFNRAGAFILDGIISGTGALEQLGANGGAVVLTGKNTYSGATTVRSGFLQVDGDQSGATGLTSVLDRAALTGKGIIGGDVDVADGGMLSPGSQGAGTLTINGSLRLNSGSILDYDFGQANVVGGALNDLIVVRGNLVLDGTLDVTATAGSSFGGGVYRIISYDGALSDNGLTLGDVPNAGMRLQTAFANQVNLINSHGLTLGFWDGPNGTIDDGKLGGGSGMWKLADGNMDWSNENGSVNADYSNGAMAVFMGNAGTVTVSNENGQVRASGLQFATDGYVIDGEPLELAGDVAGIRVGDGTTGGAGMKATLNAVLTGDAALSKRDLGTLVLTGVNTYTGGTVIEGGTLQIANDGNLGASAGRLTLGSGILHTTGSISTARAIDVTGNGYLHTSSGTTLALDGTLTGGGALGKSGEGTLILNGRASHSGATRVDMGTLRAGADNVFSSLSAHDVLAAGTLDLAGHSQTVKSLANAGTVNFAGAPGTTLTVQGDYEGKNGVLALQVALGGDTAATDRMVVAGNTSGDTSIRITNRGGIGVQTVEGIKLIDVAGLSGGNFSLVGDYLFKGEEAVVAGAYSYRLRKNGIANPNDGDWYLRSELTDPSPTTPVDPNPQNPDPVQPLYQPGVPLYEAYPAALQAFNSLGSLRQRSGNRGASEGISGEDTPLGQGAWMRTENVDNRSRPERSTSAMRYDMAVSKTEAGMDVVLAERDAGTLVGGVTLQTGRITTDVASTFGNGRIKTNGHGVTGALTWYGANGVYADVQARMGWYDSELRSHALERNMVKGNDGQSYALGIEVGRAFTMGQGWTLTPQAQLGYSNVEFDDFTDPFGARVSIADGSEVLSRVGLSMDYRSAWEGKAGAGNTHVYGIANLYRNFQAGTQVNVDKAGIQSRNERLWGGLGMGGSVSWSGGRYTVYGELEAKTAMSDFGGDSNSLGGTVGFRMQW